MSVSTYPNLSQLLCSSLLLFSCLQTHAKNTQLTNNTGAIELAGQTANNIKTHTTLPRSVHSALQTSGVPDSAISIVVQEVGSKQPLLSHLADKKRLPASTLKTVTTFAALDALGPNFRWKNRIYYTGYIKAGHLHGDLIIKGGGDPKLVREYIEDMFTRVHRAGISDISGNIILDNSVFANVSHDPATFDGKPLRPYNAAPDGLLVNFKSVVFKFYPEVKAGVVNIVSEPAMSGVDFHTRAVLASGRCGGKKAWQKQLNASFTATTARFSGSYPTSCGERSWSVALPDPNAFAPRVLKGMWLASGGKLSGKVFYGSKPSSAKHVLTYQSLPLKRIITDINQWSNNVMTEQVFLSLPVYARQGGYTHQGTYGNAQRWMTRWWRKNLPKSVQPRITKASGLCRNCTVPASSLNALLQKAATHKHANVYKQSLGVAGVSGTIKAYKHRKPNSPAIGNAYIKTGTLDNVTSIAGFIHATSGKTYTVVGMINHPKGIKARPALDELMDWVAKQ